MGTATAETKAATVRRCRCIRSLRPAIVPTRSECPAVPMTMWSLWRRTMTAVDRPDPERDRSPFPSRVVANPRSESTNTKAKVRNPRRKRAPRVGVAAGRLAKRPSGSVAEVGRKVRDDLGVDLLRWRRILRKRKRRRAKRRATSIVKLLGRLRRRDTIIKKNIGRQKSEIRIIGCSASGIGEDIFVNNECTV